MARVLLPTVRVAASDVTLSLVGKDGVVLVPVLFQAGGESERAGRRAGDVRPGGAAVGAHLPLQTGRRVAIGSGAKADGVPGINGLILRLRGDDRGSAFPG